EFERGLVWGHAALRVAKETQHPPSLLVAHDYLGYVHLLHGDLHAAVPLLERALALATEHDLLHGAVRTSSRLAYVLSLLGESERGLGVLGRALERYTTRVTPPVRAYGTTIASAYVAAGAHEEARAEIHQRFTAAAERHARGHLALLQRLAAEIHAHDGDSAGARACLEKACATAGEQEMRPEVAHCHLGLGKLSRRIGKIEQAHEHLTTA